MDAYTGFFFHNTNILLHENTITCRMHCSCPDVPKLLSMSIPCSCFIVCWTAKGAQSAAHSTGLLAQCSCQGCQDMPFAYYVGHNYDGVEPQIVVMQSPLQLIQLLSDCAWDTLTDRDWLHCACRTDQVVSNRDPLWCGFRPYIRISDAMGFEDLQDKCTTYLQLKVLMQTTVAEWWIISIHHYIDKFIITDKAQVTWKQLLLKKSFRRLLLDCSGSLMNKSKFNIHTYS